MVNLRSGVRRMTTLLVAVVVALWITMVTIALRSRGPK